ncbi:hypothetical protein [uncultured Pseudomonas sp.]|uniref:hypothetical protein n=1 Tax=uncultured Pseudomonas sp. TaxID=114707 RepID=UPI0025E5F437|nr:hypothetical protein [uncultured Pseudomonas sp.]
MESEVSYTLALSDVFELVGAAICGSGLEIAIFDGEAEIDRLQRRGKVATGSYRETYRGKPDLRARLVSGSGAVSFTKTIIPAT